MSSIDIGEMLGLFIIDIKVFKYFKVTEIEAL